MSIYYDVMNRIHPHVTLEDPAAAQGESAAGAGGSGQPRSLVALPAVSQLPCDLAQSGAIQQLSEQLAPLAVVDGPIRLLVSGCRPGDGASTVAAALAVDLSQRLGHRTMLVDANLHRPSLHRFFDQVKGNQLVLRKSLQVRPSGWRRLDFANCVLINGEAQREQLLSEFEELLPGYSAVVVDLGVARLDAQMLALARPGDPILLVARYGHSERRELATTAAALRTANRTPAGVIFNAAAQAAFERIGG